MAKIIFQNPLSFQNGTGFTTDPSNTEVNALTPVHLLIRLVKQLVRHQA